MRWWTWLISPIVVCVLWSDTFGAEWSVRPTFQTRGQYNDNLRLTNQRHKPVWTTWFGPNVQLKYATETLSITANPKLEYVLYFGDRTNETFVNHFIPLSGEYLTERDRYALDFSSSRENSLVSDLEESGVVTDFRQRSRQEVDVFWDRVLTERMTLQSSYQFADVSYDDGIEVGLFDFQTHTGSVGGIYQFTEETDVQITSWYSNFHSTDIGYLSQSYGLNLGLSHNFSETFSGSINGGVRKVKISSRSMRGRQRDSSFVWVMSTSVEKEWERTRLNVSYNRQLTPSGQGVLLTTDRFQSQLSHSVIEKRLSVALDGSYVFNDSVGSSDQRDRFRKSQYWQVRPSCSWHWQENVVLNLSYRFAQRIQKTANGRTASSNAVNVGLTYTWPKWSLSR